MSTGSAQSERDALDDDLWAAYWQGGADDPDMAYRLHLVQEAMLNALRQEVAK